MQTMPMSTEANREVCSIISTNLRTLIRENGLTQRKLAEQLGIAPATMNDYCSGRRAPQATFLVELRKLYGINIDDFLTTTTHTTVSSQRSQAAQDSASQSLREVYGKYCGPYYTYYMDTSKFKGRDTLSPAMALMYGILYIYEDPASVGGIRYSCAAVLGIQAREEADRMMKVFRSSASPEEVLNEIENTHSSRAYYGSFELSQEHAFLNLRHAGTDRALAILHRVDSNKDQYVGGIATINSVSKGRERMPVIQFFGTSRHRITMSAEDIQHALLLNYPSVIVDAEIDEILRVIRTLYIENDDARNAFSQDQKRAVVRSVLERAVRRNLSRNAFRYAKISEEDDDTWYHAIKASAEEED